MKKIISLVLVVVSLLTLSLLCLTGCGAANKVDVAILWSGNGKVEVPNSLINSIERAMYIENVSYTHYGADGDLNKQVEQANEALEAGCPVLLVELVADNGLEFVGSQVAAKQIVDAAKEKDVPVIFFNCVVDTHIIESYDKCVLVGADSDTIVDVQAQMLADYAKDSFKDIDKNEDNKITVLNYGSLIADSVVAKANEILATDDYKVSRSLFGDKFNLAVELSKDLFATADLTKCELILTDDDKVAYEVLVKLQEKDYNTDKLKEQFVPIVTVGNTVDYKALVIADRPEIPENLIIKEGDSDKVIKEKDNEIKKIEALKEYYESKMHLVDLTAVDESDLSVMIYTTLNVVSDGRIVGTTIEDNDAISIAVATITRNFIKGNDPFKDVAKQEKDKPATVIVEGSVVKVRYTSVTAE